MSKEALNIAIQHVSKAVSNKTTIPILSGIKIDASSQEGIVLTASDTDISIQSYILLEQDESTVMEIEQEGSVVVPGKLFIEIVRKLPAETLEFTVTDNFHITIRSGSTELQMIGLDPEEYPMLPKLDEQNTITIQSDILKSMIRQTIFAVSTNESTPILTGILWNLEQQILKFVATDRHRLSTRECTIETDPNVTLNNIVISGKNLSELLKLLPDENTIIEIIAAHNQILFRMDKILFYTSVLDGTYPDTTKIIPQSFQSEIVLNTKAFTNAMERAYLLSREEKTNIVKMVSFPDHRIEISSSLSELGKITDQLDVVQMTGNPIKISFNSRYMLDALKSIDSESIHIGFTGAMSPFILKPMDHQNLLHLILPYRTTN